MPPFVSTSCPHCNKPNRFDMAELRKKGTSLIKGVTHRQDEKDEAFEETCQHCGRKFKFTVKGGNNGKT